MLMLSACGREVDQVTNNSIRKNKEIIVLGLDISKSYKKPLIKREFIEELCLSAEKDNKFTTIYIHAIGNPTENPIILKVDIEGLGVVKDNLTLRQKRDAVLINKKRKEQNSQVIDMFLESYRESIYHIPKTAQTSLKGFNEWLTILCKEDRYEDFNKTLLLASDGVNSIGGNDRFYPLEEQIPNLNIYCYGLKKGATPFVQDFKEISSYQAFIDNLKL